jgi:hypothetical protein
MMRMCRIGGVRALASHNNKRGCWPILLGWLKWPEEIFFLYKGLYVVYNIPLYQLVE